MGRATGPFCCYHRQPSSVIAFARSGSTCKRYVLPGFCAHHFVRWTGAFEKGEWATWVVPGPSTIRPSTANFGRRASRSVGATHRRWPDTAGDAGERGQSPGSAVLWLELLSSMW